MMKPKEVEGLWHKALSPAQLCGAARLSSSFSRFIACIAFSES